MVGGASCVFEDVVVGWAFDSDGDGEGEVQVGDSVPKKLTIFISMMRWPM